MMANVSPVEHQYQFERASTVSDDLAAQVLYLTENMRRLQNDMDQFNDPYDESTVSANLGSGWIEAVRAVPPQATTDIQEAYIQWNNVVQGTTETEWFSVDTTANGSSGSTAIKIKSPISTATYILSGKFGWSASTAGARTHSIYTSTGLVVQLEAISMVTSTGTAGEPKGDYNPSWAYVHQPGSSATEYKIRVVQNSGSGLNVTATFQLARIS
jgi:hypothetical protein